MAQEITAERQAEIEQGRKLYELGLTENGKVLISVLEQSIETAMRTLYRNSKLEYKQMIEIAERARALESIIFILKKKPEGGTK